MRTPVRRSALFSVLALWLAAVLMGASIAVLPKMTASSTARPITAADTATPTAAEAFAIIRGSVSTPKLSPRVPVRGQAFVVSGKASTKVARPVTLQRQSGSKWVKVASTMTSSRGAFTFRVTTSSSVVRYRVRAGKATVASRQYAVATSRSVLVRTVGITPAAPMASERFSVTYSLTKAQVKKARSVLIQRKSGRSWVTIGSGRVTSRGSVTATAVLSATSTVRVYVPKVKIKKRKYRAASSASFVVPVAVQSISLSLPSSATVSVAMSAVVAGSPLRVGRTVTIQQLSGAVWTDVASGPQTADRTTLSIAATAAGTVSYRAVSAAYNGATASVSAPVTVVVQDAGPGAPVISISSLSVGVAGTSYETTLSSSGGIGEVTWTAVGLPAGLSLSSAGVLTGTPSDSGTFDVTFIATDSEGKSASKTITFTIKPAVSVATSTLPDGVVGIDYLLALTAAGGTAPFTWVATGLPAGLSIEGDDTISGQPTATGTSEVQLTVTDSNGKTAEATLNLVVVDPVAITTTSLANGEVGDTYSQQLAAGGGDGTYAWAVTAGSLPAGLALSSAGLVSGTPTATESAGFTVTVTDTGGRTASADLNITVTGLQVTSTSLAEGTVGQAYSQELAASGGDASYSWSVTSGTLPDGLSLASDGTISGTATAASSGEVTFTVTDGKSRAASATLTVKIAGVLEVSNTTLAAGVVGDDYSVTLAAAGGSGPYTWQATGLPLGIELSGGKLVGIPTAAGSSTVELTVSDDAGRTATASLELVVGPAVAVTTTSLPYAVASELYSATLGASGGTAPYTWAATGLPSGISVNSETGVLSGTPAGSEAGTTATVELTVSDAHHKTATATVQLALRGSLGVTTSTLPEGTVNVAYTQTLAAAGGLAPYSWSVVSGLPSGMSLSTGGVLSGTPTATGDSNIEVKVTDASDPALTSTATLVLTVKDPVSITTTSVSEATVGGAHDQSLAASGGTSPYAWSVVGGTLPEGLSLSTDGTLSGTPTSSQSVSISVKVTDHVGRTASLPMTVTVKDPVSITTTSLSEGTVGAAYEATFAATGGTTPFEWNAEEALPDGLSLSTGGVLSGTPTSATNGASITVKVTDHVGRTASKALTLKVSGPLSLVTASLPSGVAEDDYAATLEAAGGSGAYTWVVTGLPNGIARNGVELSGAPAAPGTYQVGVSVSDEAGRVVNGTFALVVGPKVAVTTTSLPHAVTTVGYGATLAASGGTEPYTWSAEGLPAGLELKPGTGELTGIPSDAAGNTTASVVVTVTDAHSKTATATVELDVLVPVAVVESTLPEATVGAGYDVTLTPGGGVGPYTWSTTSTLPDGVVLSDTGRLFGTPDAAGSYDIVVQVHDSSDPQLNGSTTLTLKVADPLAVSTATLPAGTVGVAYEQTLAESGGTSPLVWSIASGTLPAGVNLSAAGLISGTPSAAGDSVVTVSATDSVGRTATAELTISVKDPVAITTASLPDGTVTVAYSQSLAASGGDGSYTWSITNGSLPDGLSLAADGTISGTPSAASSSTFTVTVTDATGRSASAELSLRVSDPLAVSTATLPAGTVGVAYEQTLAATGGATPLVWSVAEGVLPGGVSLSAGGVVSGTPSIAGDSVVTVKATDSVGRTATAELTISVKDPVAITTTGLPDGTTTVAYSQSLAASGGDGSYTWSITAGALPDGLSLAADGTISGTPSAAASSTFTTKVTDATGRTASVELSLEVATPVVISTTSLASALQNEAYDQTLGASGGVSPYTWQVTGMPSGLSVDASTGQVTGTPSESGAFTFSISVTDAKARTATAEIAVNVTAAVAITTTSLADGVAQANYSQTVAASGGTAPYQWSATGLPTGLSIDADTGVISGTTSVTKSSTATVTVTDAHTKTSTRELTIWIEGVEALAGGGGGFHTCALLSSGGVKCWGLNGNGQLGNGTKNSSSTPVQVTGLTSGVTQISALGNHTCALLDTGAMKCWGENPDGEIGDGTTVERWTPTQVSGLTSGVSAISVGLTFTCAKVGSAAKCWGRNSDGQLGDNSTTNRVTPVQVSGLTSNVTAIVAGSNGTCAVVSGAAKCWGLNVHGQVGDGTNTQRNVPTQVTGLTSGVAAMALRSTHACALLSTGGVKCWGGNAYGELGDNTTTERWAPTQVSGLTSGVTALTSGQFHMCALQSSGAVKCWGSNADGRLGDGTYTQRNVPTQVTGLTSGATEITGGTSHSCALVGGLAYCWGLNGDGQLGLGNLTSYNTPQKVHLFS